MKLTDHFRNFLVDSVNLNDSRIQILDDSIEAIKTFIRASDWKPQLSGFEPQGSWAHKTIIRPQNDKAFDADLIAYVDEVEGWTAANYIDELYVQFKDSGTYKDMVRRYSHCVTIEYVNERKIDVAPCIKNRTGVQRTEVCNRTLDAFEKSEPAAYTAWIAERNDWTSNNSFRKVTRLIKYLRDIKGTFTCPSVLLTTLLGMTILATDGTSDDFSDVPTALVTIMRRLDDWAQINATKPEVRNPVLWQETFSNAWDEDKYQNFREWLNTYRIWMDDAYAEQDRDESIGKWRRVFGDDFAKSAVLKEASAVSGKALAVLRAASLASTGLSDLVSAVRQFGSRALYPGFARQPHLDRPTWKPLPTPLFAVSISATLHTERDGQSMGPVHSLQVLPKHHWLRFVARTSVGSPLSDDFDVRWRVANTDEEAFAADCMRGHFEKSQAPGVRWEQLQYRGVHIVEAFVLRKRDNRLASQSAPFYVTIE